MGYVGSCWCCVFRKMGKSVGCFFEGLHVCEMPQHRRGPCRGYSHHDSDGAAPGFSHSSLQQRHPSRAPPPLSPLWRC